MNFRSIFQMDGYDQIGGHKTNLEKYYYFKHESEWERKDSIQVGRSWVHLLLPPTQILSEISDKLIEHSMES